MNPRFARRALDLACGTRGNRRLLIFTFHRVLATPDALLPDEPTADSFAQRLLWMRDYLQVLPLPQAAQQLCDGTLPPRAASITFDDGYRNNAEIAQPLLEQNGLQATFFVATGAIEQGAMWNDLVIEAVRNCGDRLDFAEFDLPSWDIPSEASRRQFVLRILDQLKYLPLPRRAVIARALYAKYCNGSRAEFMMTRAMVRDLALNGHDVGAHTVTHPILQQVDDADARAEIEGSRDWVTSVTGRAPVSFAYPNGRPGVDFSSTHVRMVDEAGFKCAVSTTWGCATPRSNMLSLERFTPWEDSPSGFVRRILKTYVRSYMS